MATTNKTPLWLELKKEYIDDNFEKLLPYLRENGSDTTDAFYSQTIALLSQRVEELITTLSEKPIYEEEQDRPTRIFNIRLLATFILVQPDSDLALPAYVAMTNELRMLVPKFSEQLLHNVMCRMTHEKVTNHGVTLLDIIDFKPELFAHHLFTASSFDVPLKKPLVYEKYGSAFIFDKGLYLTYENHEDGKKLLKSGASSMETDCGCSLRTASSAKLKKSDEDNLVAMDQFVKDFISSQWEAKKPKPQKRLHEYNEGDVAIVRISKIALDGTIHVETLDDRYQPMSGTIRFEKPSIVYYYTNTLFHFFKEGDILKATVSSTARNTFCIESQLTDFFVNDTKENYTGDDTMLAKCIDEKTRYLGWINERGVGIYTPNTGEYRKGDLAFLRITGYSSGSYWGKIDAEIVEPAYENDVLDEGEVRRDCIRDFAESTEAPQKTVADKEPALSPLVLKQLFRLFFAHQRSLLKPSERYRYLGNAQVMAELVGDEMSSSYIRFAATYLRALVQFVKNDSLADVKLEPEDSYRDAKPTLIRLSILALLKEYGKTDNSPVLAETIEDFKESIPLLSRLARLIQTANSMQGTLSDASINVIKREIIKTLSLETENDADLEADSGIYLGVESGTVEFKTSIVFPPNNDMQPNQKVQTHNVFKAICAFLNSTNGGTLYLGVNDQGYVVGLDADMKQLRCSTVDQYARVHIQDPLVDMLGLDAMTYIRIETMYDDQVLAIHVEPHPYRIVDLEGTAYIRVNAESREMSEKLKQEMIARKVFTDKNKAAAISQLQHAMSQRKCAILHAYASSNSGKVSDRLVEPYKVLPEDRLAICYDRNKFACRVFNISRIGYVEVLEDNWKYPASHKPIEVDAFHMSGDKPIRVSLELDLMAKNQLIEEYPRTKDDIAPCKGNENVWYLTTTVFAIEGIARFYLGLAHHIKILEAPELKAYVDDFKEKYL